jgi:hypothetical protein
MRQRVSLIGVSLLMVVSCVDYDLNRPDNKEEPAFDTGEPPPEEPSEEPDILVSPMSLDFGSVLKDCTSDPQTVTVTNEGKAALEVSAISLGGNGTSSFEQTGGPMSLSLGETATFEVTFTPSAWLDFDVNVLVESNDPDEPTVRVDALGTGAEGSVYEESFTQDYIELVDVLWVVDNSCSMDDELVTMGKNFQAFINAFSDLEIDYHIGVITTDMDSPSDSGRFQGPWLDSSTPNLATEFNNQVNQGTSGSATEQGFAAVRAALSEPLISSSLHDGFLREDAALSVIIISDENDNSGINSSNFTSWFQDLKPSDPTLARFNAFCGDRFLGCQDPFNSGITASGGDKYIDAVDLTSGFFASICSSDYSVALQELSFSSAGMTLTFYLTEEPETLDGMVVLVDGKAWPQDSDNGWTYDPENNSITFNGDAIPGPGAEVNVSYTTAGECG